MADSLHNRCSRVAMDMHVPAYRCLPGICHHSSQPLQVKLPCQMTTASKFPVPPYPDLISHSTCVVARRAMPHLLSLSEAFTVFGTFCRPRMSCTNTPRIFPESLVCCDRLKDTCGSLSSVLLYFAFFLPTTLNTAWLSVAAGVGVLIVPESYNWDERHVEAFAVVLICLVTALGE